MSAATRASTRLKIRQSCGLNSSVASRRVGCPTLRHVSRLCETRLLSFMTAWRRLLTASVAAKLADRWFVKFCVTQVWHCCVEVKAQLRVCACVNIGVETATGACTHKYSDPDGFNYSLVARGVNETACTAHELPTIADVVDGQDGVGRQQSTRFVTSDGHWAEQEHMTMRAKGQCCKHTCTRTACLTRQHGLVRHCPWLKFWMHFHVILSQMDYMRQPLHNLSGSWKTVGFFRCLRPIITDLSEYPKMSNLERNDFVIF